MLSDEAGPGKELIERNDLHIIHGSAVQLETAVAVPVHLDTPAELSQGSDHDDLTGTDCSDDLTRQPPAALQVAEPYRPSSGSPMR